MIKVFTSYTILFLLTICTFSAKAQNAQDSDKISNGLFKVEQNYPNPVTSFTNITFTLVKDSYVSLKIFDPLGNEVLRVVDGQMKSGEHTMEVDLTSLETGIYFYRLSVNDRSETKKLTVKK